MQDFDNGNLKIKLSRDGEYIKMLWLGDSRTLNPASQLEPYLFPLVRELRNKKLVIDFTQLNSMNSSTVMPILFFMRNLEKLAVITQIHYKGSSSWQRASFEVIANVVFDYNFIEVIAK